MIHIDNQGYISDKLVTVKKFPLIEHSSMPTVNGIIVHQTDSNSAESCLSQYATSTKGVGAHFLIDKDGTIYQTASLYKQAWHVGLLKSRCLMKKSCLLEGDDYYETKKGKNGKPIKNDHRKPSNISTHENTKSFPDRFPSNEDSIGIELVGKAKPKDPKHPLAYANPDNLEASEFEEVSYAQNCALKWLVAELQAVFKLQMIETHRHPVVSWKNLSEGYTAKWQK